MTGVKRKISVSLDDDLVSELEASDEGLSAQVNTALRNEMNARRRQRGLRALLDELEAQDGPLNSAEDEADVQRYMRLLGGTP
jgi:post-segregation antitoxin (ccd killing protein)